MHKAPEKLRVAQGTQIAHAPAPTPSTVLDQAALNDRGVLLEYQPS
jgi:hypothetical protein